MTQSPDFEPHVKSPKCISIAGLCIDTVENYGASTLESKSPDLKLQMETLE